MGWACSTYGGEAYTMFWLEKRPRVRHKRRSECNIKMDLQGVGCGSMDWIKLAQDRDRWRALVNVVMNLRVS